MRAVGAVTAKMVPKKAAKPPQSQQRKVRTEWNSAVLKGMSTLCAGQGT